MQSTSKKKRLEILPAICIFTAKTLIVIAATIFVTNYTIASIAGYTTASIAGAKQIVREWAVASVAKKGAVFVVIEAYASAELIGALEHYFERTGESAAAASVNDLKNITCHER